MRKTKVACFCYKRHCDVYVSNVWFSTGVLRSILDAFQNQRIDGFQLTGGGGVGIDVHVTESYTRPVPSLKKQTNRTVSTNNRFNLFSLIALLFK